jgi:predicted CXXCH cytochrome family protein
MKIGIALVSFAVVTIGAGITYRSISRGSWALGSSSAAIGSATFVGSETCADCHRTEAALWNASQHQRAMSIATEASVLGDFKDASFDYYGVHSQFFRKDGKFVVKTDGPDGRLADFAVKYTFGIDPLQQYLVEFPDGRLQALSLAWDSRPKEQGGQRWFHLYPSENIAHDDPLHWTRLNQNWNFMCAECHSTGVRKNYDSAKDRFSTTWAEINVGCEACHGQGSPHVAWAKSQRSWWPFGKVNDPFMGLAVRFDDRSGVAWSTDPATGKPHRSVPPTALRKQVETCGLCHARRGVFSEDWLPGRWLSDTHDVAELSASLFSADGQMLDEVYNYASFKQSKMFAAGVTCSDCHDPHSAELRLPGDGVCLQCHSADKYETTAHSHHPSVNPTLACASCHMPSRTYMVVDRRHDHSFRVPRPDVSVKLGTPNACNDCHADKSAQWAAAAVEGWFGPDREGSQHYAEAFQAARVDGPHAAELLAGVAADGSTPAIARATALSDLAAYLSPANVDIARNSLRDPDPMVRIGAMEMLESAPTDLRWQLASPFLTDPVRGVRVRAASLLADIPMQNVPPQDHERLDSATAEFIAGEQLNADRPEAHATLGTFYARRGQAADAVAEYQRALRLSPQFTPAAANLADLYRHLGRDMDSETVLRAALTQSPNDAGLRHSLGLTLVRLKRLDEAIAELKRATELAPSSSRYTYVYAVALNSSGQAEDAIAHLKDNLAQHPEDRDTLMALISISRSTGNVQQALTYARELSRLVPDDPNVAQLVDELRNGVGPLGRH